MGRLREEQFGIPSFNVEAVHFGEKLSLGCFQCNTCEVGEANQIVNRRCELIGRTAHESFQCFFYSQMGEEKSMPDPAAANELVRDLKIFQATTLPVCDLFCNVHHSPDFIGKCGKSKEIFNQPMG